jgi:hypothetical protein
LEEGRNGTQGGGRGVHLALDVVELSVSRLLFHQVQLLRVAPLLLLSHLLQPLQLRVPVEPRHVPRHLRLDLGGLHEQGLGRCGVLGGLAGCGGSCEAGLVRWFGSGRRRCCFRQLPSPWHFPPRVRLDRGLGWRYALRNRCHVLRQRSQVLLKCEQAR